MLLEARNLHIGYGDASAVWDVSLGVAASEIVSVIGPNGAGKTTLINAIAGLLRCRRGELRFDGCDMNRVAAHDYCSHGIALVPEGRRLFAKMSVEENLELGCYLSAARAHREQSLERVDGAAAHRAVRRAVAWAGTHHRRRHVRDHRAGARGGRGCAAGRAERAEGARHRRPCLRAGAGTDREH